MGRANSEIITGCFRRVFCCLFVCFVLILLDFAPLVVKKARAETSILCGGAQNGNMFFSFLIFIPSSER